MKIHLHAYCPRTVVEENDLHASLLWEPWFGENSNLHPSFNEIYFQVETSEFQGNLHRVFKASLKLKFILNRNGNVPYL